MKLVKNILKFCPAVEEAEFFKSDNTLAIFKAKDAHEAKRQVQSYLSATCSSWLGLRIVFY